MSLEISRHQESLRTHWYTRIYQCGGKRAVDLLLAVIGFVLLSPILFFASVVLLGVQGRPILFRQTRPGRYRIPFVLYKFRTMLDSHDASGNELPDSERLTPIGRLFRRFSLDELPTFLNVIKGDMSLVGPRPLLVKYLPFFSEQEIARFSVRPGITGLAQISGRNELEWGKRLALDVQYVQQLSWRKDLSIIVRTIGRVLTSRGVQPDPGSVMQDLDVERSSPARPVH